MTDAADKRAPLSLSETRSTADANDLALLKRLAGYACGSLSDSFSIRQLGGLALRLLAEHATLRAKLAEAERAWEQHESGDVSCSWHELATGQTIEAERAKAERDAATARAAEAERLLELEQANAMDWAERVGKAERRADTAERLLVALEKGRTWQHGKWCVCAACEDYFKALAAARSHLQSLKAKEPTDGE